MNNFFAMLYRMRYIDRWGLMNNTRVENISEHSLDVAVISHALVTIANKRFGANLSADRAAVIGMFHDASEIITGDLPTPVKYYNEEIKNAYKQIESVSEQSLLSMLPDDLRSEYEELISSEETDKELLPYVKAADKLSAYIKCVEEQKAGNTEFDSAAEATMVALKKLQMSELDWFIDNCLEPFRLNLDQL